METHVFLSGAVVGLIAGAISGIVTDIFMLVSVYAGGFHSLGPGIQFWPSPSFYLSVTTPFLVIPVLLELVVGVLSGLVFSIFHQSAADHVAVRRGLKYGLALPLPFIFLGVWLLRYYLDPLHLAIYYVLGVVLPVLLFGLLLVRIWNWNWGI
jgi:hypothetical protein